MVDIIEGAPDPAPPAKTRLSWGDRVRSAVFGLGELMITAGVVVLLFVFYEVYVTNIFAHREQAAVRKVITKVFTDPGDPDPLGAQDGATLPLPGADTSPSAIPDGTGIAVIYIPRLGSDYSFAIVQGTTADDLTKGPGHYIGTALPGQIGNFAVAGHRVGNGEPFLNLDYLRPGDPVIIHTKKYWFVYQVLGANGSLSAKDPNPNIDLPGREIVDPSDSDVLLPWPDHTGGVAKTALLTLTTCNPKFTAQNRMIVYSKLIKKLPSTGVAFPAAIQSYYAKS